jgi:hypothetical protein
MKLKLPSLKGKSKKWIAEYKRLFLIEYRKLQTRTPAEMESDFQKLFHEQRQTTGAMGGRTRAKNLTAKRRKAIARKAARARWAKKGKR